MLKYQRLRPSTLHYKLHSHFKFSIFQCFPSIFRSDHDSVPNLHNLLWCHTLQIPLANINRSSQFTDFTNDTSGIRPSSHQCLCSTWKRVGLRPALVLNTPQTALMPRQAHDASSTLILRSTSSSIRNIFRAVMKRCVACYLMNEN